MHTKIRHLKVLLNRAEDAAAPIDTRVADAKAAVDLLRDLEAELVAKVERRFAPEVTP